MQRVLFLSGRAASDRRAAATPPQQAVRTAAVVATFFAAAAADAGAGSFTVSGVSPERSRGVIEHAERVRSAAFSSLLGRAAPEPWRVRCGIHVHATPASFAAAVGGPPAVARGATSIEFGEHAVLLRRIDVMAGDGLVPDALDHEIVHVVLADHFHDGPPPRWADEGLAVLFDPPEKQRQHEADFRSALMHGREWHVRDLLALEEYPSATERQRVFYGQSAAVVRWLIARRDAATFIRFLDDSAAHGTEAALAIHYGLDSTAALSQAWEKPSGMSVRGIAAVPQ